MLKLLSWMIKISLFTGAILIASHLITWRGRTISDQVKTQLSHAERLPAVRQSTKRVKGWIGSERETTTSPEQLNALHAFKASEELADKDDDSDQLRSSERQKLRSLITELNKTSESGQHRE